jgi:integrase
MYLEQRRRGFYAIHDLPRDVADAFGKRRLIQSLKTRDLDVARIRGAAVEAQWLSAIKRVRDARQRPHDTFQASSSGYGPSDKTGEAPWVTRPVSPALDWRHGLTVEEIGAKLREWMQGASPEQREALWHVLSDTIDDIAGPDRADQEAHPAVQRMVAIATGALVKLDLRLEEYLATLTGRVEGEEIDRRRNAIAAFAVKFPYVQDVTRKALRQWLDASGKAPKTLRRLLSVLRGYWKWLQEREEIEDANRPFDDLTVGNGSAKQAKAKEIEPWELADIARLTAMLREKGDTQLLDIVEIAKWTGARVEEICSLPVEGVNLAEGVIEIADAKSPAGWRQVPIHSKLAPTLARMIGGRREGFVIEGLTTDKHGDRSKNPKTRFSTYKSALGFGRTKVFHSFRHTVTTQLVSAGVLEHVISAIVGHRLRGITLGRYGHSGITLAQKREAIERLTYPA